MVLGKFFLKGVVVGGEGGGTGLALSFLHLEITLLFAKLCYAFEEKR